MIVRLLNRFRRYFDSLVLLQVARRWGTRGAERAQINTAKSRWWQFAQINQHIDHKVFLQGDKSGFVESATYEHQILPCERGVSVGCGNAIKELDLLRRDLVQHFDLYEISGDRVAEARLRAESLGLQDRVTFIQENVFDRPANKDTYDLVYWDNSLHHMFDVEQAVSWSYQVLKAGGGFMMNDFIGPSRFQWSDAQLYYATRIRECFTNTKYLVNPRDSDKTIPTMVHRPSKMAMIYDDPSEAADSSRIISALEAHFPSATVLKTGGVVYHLALNDMLANFDEDEDAHLIKLLLLIDDMLIKEGEAHYAVAFAKKE